MQAPQLTFKLVFGEENIRRFTIQPTTLENFQNLLVSLYPDFYHQEMTIQYVDADNDRISLSSEMEWQEMLFQLRNNIKLYVVENKKNLFKDGPAPEVVKVFGSNGEENAALFQAEIQKVTEALTALFPSNKILPYNIPSFLSGIIGCKTTGTDQADLEIDFNLAKISDALHREAIRLMDTADKKMIAQAKKVLLSQLTLDTTNPVTLYNLACAEALLGDAVNAVEWLQKAISNGYSNFVHMAQDPDLVLLRGVDAFQALFKQEVKTPEPEPEVKVPEPEPEVKAPEPEPEVPAPDVDANLALQLQTLHDMGFLDDSILVPSLQQYGTIDATLSHLFQ